MTRCFRLAALLLFFPNLLFGQVRSSRERLEAEYYVGEYARHYDLPIEFVRALIQKESGWNPRAVSSKDAVGLMQLMPSTARRLGVQDRFDVRENVRGGVVLLAWLTRRFEGDLRLVAAGYIAGEDVVARRGLRYSNPEVLAYVSRIRASCQSNPRRHYGNSTMVRSRAIR